MWKANEAKKQMVMELGVTAGLPLFNDVPLKASTKRLPDWIWDGTGIKARVFDELKKKFQQDSFEYLAAVIELGGSATDHEVKDYFNDPDKWGLHIVSARRNYWCGAPRYVVQSYPGREKPGPKGKLNTIWYINFLQLKELTEV